MFAVRLQKQNPALSLMIPGRSVFTLACRNGNAANAARRNLAPVRYFLWDHKQELSITAIKSARIAILSTDGFGQSELFKPEQALEAAPATVLVLLKDASQEDYDALVLPGGQMNPDIPGTLPEAISFVNSLFRRQ